VEKGEGRRGGEGGYLQLPPADDKVHSPLMAKLLQFVGGSLHT
jgi:hypothetical protein